MLGLLLLLYRYGEAVGRGDYWKYAYSLKCDELVSQACGGAGKSMLGIRSQKTTRVVVLRMRETYSLCCRLVDHALAQKDIRVVIVCRCRVVVREQRTLAKG
jgi:hypothetical protein